MITIKKDHYIATVTLDRPAKHNAFDDAVIKQLTEAFIDVDKDDSILIMILAAQGKNFSAGGDLSWMKRMANYSHAENLADARKLANMLKTLNGMSKPTIAKVQGAAYGGAVGLISCCDMVVASDDSSYCLSEVKIGLMPATISPYVMAAMGERAARRYFLTAERFDANTALSTGLVSQTCKRHELESTVQSLVGKLLKNSPQAISQTKKLIFDVSTAPLNDALIEETSLRIAMIRMSDEGQEGLTAFLEKRQPAWIKSGAEGSLTGAEGSLTGAEGSKAEGSD